MLHGPKKTQIRAAQLRRAMSLPEVLLLKELRKRADGLRFAGSIPPGAIYSISTVLSGGRDRVHGEAHSRGDRPARDMSAMPG